MKLTKAKNNPILRPNPANEWENLCVLNPAVIYDDVTNEFVMLYRAAGDTRGALHPFRPRACPRDGVDFDPSKRSCPWSRPTTTATTAAASRIRD
ncbi:MAG: hypothetical protein MZU97_19925 [Bacillus subtilis]|nr:hypothetical protein [Bacillus subtilis]